MKSNSAIILLLISIGLFYTFTSGQYQDVKELYNLSNQYKSILKNASEIIALRDSLLASYRSLPQSEIDRITKMLPDNVDTVHLALDLDSLAARYGITVKNIRTENAADSGSTPDIISLDEDDGVSLGRATISFSFISSYQNFIAFMSELEKNLRIMDTKTVLFRTGESNLYEFGVTADIYWLK